MSGPQAEKPASRLQRGPQGVAAGCVRKTPHRARRAREAQWRGSVRVTEPGGLPGQSAHSVLGASLHPAIERFPPRRTPA